MVEFCSERGMGVSNTYFDPNSLHNYTRVARGQNGGEVRIMIELVLENKDMLSYV